MTDAEYQKIMAEAAAKVARTTIGRQDPRDAYESHGHHAEYGASRH